MVIPIKFKTSLRTKVITFYPIYIKDQTDGAYHQIVIFLNRQLSKLKNKHFKQKARVNEITVLNQNKLFFHPFSWANDLDYNQKHDIFLWPIAELSEEY